MKQVLSVTATFADGVARRVAHTTNRALAVRAWRYYHARGSPCTSSRTKAKTFHHQFKEENMNLEYGDPGMYNVTVTISFNAFLNEPDDTENALREACIRLENGEVMPTVEAELNSDETNEYYAEKAAEYLADK